MAFILLSSFILFFASVKLKKENYAQKEDRPYIREEKMQIRKPSVSGMFYPSDPDEIKNLLKGYFEKADIKKEEGRPVCAISPHAGYVYSGPVAAYSYKIFQNKNIKTFIVIAFSHRPFFTNIAVSDADFWETPLGNIKVDKDIAQKLVDSSKFIKFFGEGHNAEHSLEVQLPFIQYIDKNASVVPVSFGSQDYKFAEILADAICGIIKGRDDVAVIASTDMSHYNPYNEAVEMDKKAVEIIQTLNVEKLYKNITDDKIELCGTAPVATVMLIADKMNLKPTVLKYANSGDTAGDKKQVVGYTAIEFTASSTDTVKEKKSDAVNNNDEQFLNKEEQAYLLGLARTTIENFFKNKKNEVKIPESKILREKRGVFVTLHKNGELKGCIGYIEGIRPLYEAVQEMALSSAFKDHRFEPLKENELKDVDIEISVLTPLKKINSVDEIILGKHGAVIKNGYNQGLFLPQVATEQGWDKKTFLEHLCYKAGLPANAWKDKDTEFSVFECQVFQER